MTRITLNFSEGLLEVEGSEAFVKNVYDDFKLESVQWLQKNTRIEEDRSGQQTTKAKNKKINSNDSGAKKKNSKKAVPTFVKDLDLSSKKNGKDLKDFLSDKNPSSNMEKNAVFIYFLKKKSLESDVTIDHLYTCYKYVNIKVPGALEQSLLDTASRKGWIDTSDLASIKLSVGGENFVEHDLPKTPIKI